MYTKIMVPVDLAHIESLEKALVTVADLSKHYETAVCYVGVSASAPSEVAHNSEEFNAKLEEFGAGQAEKFGLQAVSTVAHISHDPAVDLDKNLINIAEEVGADLIVMASHIPGFIEHIFASNAGYVASYAKISVLVVR